MRGLVASASLKELFKSLLEEAMGNQRVELTEVAEFYLVNLLEQFVTAEKFFVAEGEDGKREQEPLALLYHRALQQDREGRIRTLRRLGDVSLYRAGYFASSLRDELVGPDYYAQMGSAAYAQVASLAPSGGFALVYQELGQKFRPLIDVLEEVSARGMVSNGPQGALQVYEAWSRTGREGLTRVLTEAGLLTPASQASKTKKGHLN